MSDTADVVVIGGGQAGLAAGYYLHRDGLERTHQCQRRCVRGRRVHAECFGARMDFQASRHGHGW
jgi:glycine/D-amino acid oxidase-like deaminating enzyme